jgi:hypothetical protein
MYRWSVGGDTEGKEDINGRQMIADVRKLKLLNGRKAVMVRKESDTDRKDMKAVNLYKHSKRSSFRNNDW